MKYRLKDQGLQNRLEMLLGKEFVEDALLKGEVDNGILTIYADLSELSYVDIGIHIDDIEVIKEYDPDNWNDFPEVTPPEGVWMRCERDNFKFCAEYVFDKEDRSYKWFDDENFEQTVDRFRPWED